MPQAGDHRRSRFHAVWTAHYSAVLGYARRRHSRAAQDIVADTFLVAWRRLDQVPDDDPLPWLLAVARRVTANHQRGDARRTALLMRLGGLAREAAPDPAEIAGGPGFRAAFATLKPREREVICLAAWEGLRPEQLARVLDCSPNAAAVRLHRARAKLKDALTAHEQPAANRQAGTEVSHGR